MTKEKNEFLDLIKRQRKEKKREKFSGSFLEYLDLIKDNPETIKHSHKRLCDVIEEHGVSTLDESDSRCRKLFDGDRLRTYEYFKSEFFGMERVIAKVMRFLKSASLKGEESRQVLLLMGPVGAGKSALTEHVKRALEGISYYHLEGDPQRGEPLHLIPRGLRERFEKLLGTRIEGDLSPIARHLLMEEYNVKQKKYLFSSLHRIQFHQ